MLGRVIISALIAMAPAEVPTLPTVEDEVLAELNRVRADPHGYADELRHYRDGFDGLVAYSAEAPGGIMTREGTAAVDEAIAILDQQPALASLRPSPVLAGGAAALVDDQALSGSTGHRTSTGLGPGDRVKRNGGNSYVGEVIAYGPPNPRIVVRHLIVDDGVARRGHRMLLLSADYRFAGVSCGGHSRYGAMCVIDLALNHDGGPPLPSAAEKLAARGSD